MLSTSSESPLGELSSRRSEHDRFNGLECVFINTTQEAAFLLLFFFFYLLLYLDEHEHDQAMVFWLFVKITSYLVAALHLIPTGSKANFGLLFAFGFCKRYNVNFF